MVKISDFENLKGTRLVISDTSEYDGRKVKMLRMDILKMSQNAFSESLGVDISTIQKWENGISKPSNTAQKLLYLLAKHPELMNDLYRIIDERKEVTSSDHSAD